MFIFMWQAILYKVPDAQVQLPHQYEEISSFTLFLWLLHKKEIIEQCTFGQTSQSEQSEALTEIWADFMKQYK